LARLIGSSNEITQTVPGFAGFVSCVSAKPLQKSTIDYFTPIHHPFTEYSTVEELLRVSENATVEVGQEYVLNTFDLGGCMKVLPLIWKDPGKYEKHIVTPGPFHIWMNYIGMLTGHKCKGSGYAEILVEAQLVTNGCLHSVLSGKAYAKALYCLKTVTEALERLLIEKFLEESDIEVETFSILSDLSQSCTYANLNACLHDDALCNFLEKVEAFEEKVRAGYLGKTAQFWISVIDHARLILMFQYSVKTNNFDLFHKCNGAMADLFFAYDGPNYSRLVQLLCLQAILLSTV